MHCSLHAKKRMDERSIPIEVVNLVLQEGVTLEQNKNMYLLSKGHVNSLRIWQNYPKALIDKAEKCAPVSVVCDGTCIITAFRVHKRINRLHKR